MRLSGEGGIRTLGTVARTTVFETATIDRSATSPDWCRMPLVGGCGWALIEGAGLCVEGWQRYGFLGEMGGFWGDGVEKKDENWKDWS